MKPVILITNKFENDPIPFGIGRILSIRSNYCNAILAAGGTPLITAGGDPEEYVRMAQGILFTGSGCDITPSLYGQEASGAMDSDMELDRMELDLFQAFYQARKPILGICRGIQLINVALGGTLIQDIPSRLPDALPHRGKSDTDNRFHTIRTQSGSRMEALFGPELLTNTYHHQAIEILGKGLTVTAQSDDGIIEAVEHISAPILATQFHPERMTGQEQDQCPNMLPLFRHFIGMCK